MPRTAANRRRYPPAHHAPATLAARCPRGHRAHGRQPQRQIAYQTRRAGKTLGDLFDVAVES